MALRLPFDDQLDRARARLCRLSVAFVVALVVVGVVMRCAEGNAVIQCGEPDVQSVQVQGGKR
ncbi:MAG: hypothetical protein WC683_01255 [bacterium]